MSRFKMSNPNPHDDEKVIKGVVYTRHQWDRVLGHITKKEEDRRQAEMAAREKQDRLQLSRQMAAIWDNTLVNLRKKRFAQRQEKIDDALKARHERYLYFKAEDERRKELVRARAREIFFEQRDSTKELRSAEKLSEAIREREKQIEFNKKVKQMEKEELMREAEKIWVDADKWKQEQEEMKGAHSKAKEQRKKEALQELEKYQKEKLEKEKAQKEEEVRYLAEMKEEMEQIAEFEKQEKERFKREYLKEVMENREMTEKKRLSAIEEEKEEDLAIQIISEGKAKLARMRREKEQETFEEEIKKRERVASMVAAVAKGREEFEEACLKKAALEKQRIFEREEEKKRWHKARMREERMKAHEEYLREAARKKEAERELMKWAVLQRFKNSETTTGVYKKFNDIRWQRYLECRKANALLIEEHNTKQAKERQADLDAVKRAAAIWALNDKEFLETAAKVRDECAAAGRPSYPLEVAIADFKKRNGLLKECRGVGFIESMPIVPGYREMAEKLKKIDEKKKKAEEAKNEEQTRAITPSESSSKRTNGQIKL